MFGQKKQVSGDSSNNFQSEKIEINNNYGLTYSEAKEIAMEVFRSNFTILKNEAVEVAEKRAIEISEKILSRLFTDLPNVIDNLKTPGFQDAMFIAQKAYAKSGHETTRDLLVELLHERSKITDVNLQQIIIDEALNIIPKLTPAQLDLLTLNYLIAGRSHNKTSGVDFTEDFVNLLSPFSAPRNRYEENNLHLIYLGCAYSKNVKYSNFEKLISTNYGSSYIQNFSKEHFESIFGTIEKYSKFVRKEKDSNKYQIIFANSSMIEIAMRAENKFTLYEINLLKQFYLSLIMPEKEIRNRFFNFGEQIKNVISYWNNTKFKDLELTEIGIYIGKINYKFKTGKELTGMRWHYN